LWDTFVGNIFDILLHTLSSINIKNNLKV